MTTPEQNAIVHSLRHAHAAGINSSAPNANLWGANLWGANLWGANLWGADLRGADLWGGLPVQAGRSGSGWLAPDDRLLGRHRRRPDRRRGRSGRLAAGAGRGVRPAAARAPLPDDPGSGRTTT